MENFILLRPEVTHEIPLKEIPFQLSQALEEPNSTKLFVVIRTSYPPLVYRVLRWLSEQTSKVQAVSEATTVTNRNVHSILKDPAPFSASMLLQRFAFCSP